MTAYQARTGEHLSYAQLAQRAGISKAAVESAASRPGYNLSLAVVERLCRALQCTPGDLLTLEPPGGPTGE
ncbi:helix-turn-helix domain-containing protein [Phenylobacterium sp. LjRoot225]|uniref:helix-turn-helix domain-containing protein n=1 Tax=Phenylobacterium sp. LjRoot225 TaxID=3342285 RepID=UPI003F4F71CC